MKIYTTTTTTSNVRVITTVCATSGVSNTTTSATTSSEPACHNNKLNVLQSLVAQTQIFNTIFSQTHACMRTHVTTA